MILVILFDMFLNPSFKTMTSFTNLEELQLAQVKVNACTRKDFKSSGIGTLYKKYLILNESKAKLMLKLSLQNSLLHF